MDLYEFKRRFNPENVKHWWNDVPPNKRYWAAGSVVVIVLSLLWIVSAIRPEPPVVLPVDETARAEIDAFRGDLTSLEAMELPALQQEVKTREAALAALSQGSATPDPAAMHAAVSALERAQEALFVKRNASAPPSESATPAGGG